MKYINLKTILIVGSAVFMLILVLISPLFAISEVVITGNQELTETYIKETTGLTESKNVLAFDSSKAEKQLKENTYVEDVNIDKHFFKRSVEIDLNERKLSGYVEYTDGNYLYVDEDGVVLEVSKSFTEKLPVIVGLDIETFSLGQPLKVEDEKALENMVELSHLFNKYEMSQDVVKVDLTDPENTHLYVNNIDVSIGSIEEADIKIRTAEAAIAKLDKNAKGFLNVENIDENPIFRYMT